MTLVLGLTGSIATGKSTVSNIFKERGIPVIDADVIAREVVMIGKPAYAEIVQFFGDDILETTKEINRAKLGSIIFKDEQKRIALNEIVHPAIRQEMISQKEKYVKQGYPLIVLDIPLLFESKLTSLVDKVVVVYVPFPLQLQRLQQRNGYTVEEATARIASQVSVEEKKKWADYVIDNSGNMEVTKEKVQSLLALLEDRDGFSL